MKHRWQRIEQGPEGMMNYGKRQCVKCGLIQEKSSIHVWGRVTGYEWWPKRECQTEKEAENDE